MREIILKRNIRGYLSQLSDQVKKNIASGFTDLNKKSETKVADLLNEIFNYKLVNANDGKKNFPGIDLIDEGNDIPLGVQVTSETTQKKVNDTCTKFVKYEYYNSLKRLVFYYITDKTVNVTDTLKRNISINLEGHITFDVEKDILSNLIIFNYIDALKDLEKITNIESILSEFLALPNGGQMDPERGYIIPKRLNSYAGYSIYDLIGRDIILDTIHKMFQNANTLLLTGLGGIGKTTVARAYLERYKNEYSHLAYVDISGNLVDSLLRRLSSVDKSFQINSELSSIENLQNLIEKIRTIYNTVLVIDNCNDELELREIKPLLESLEWKVLLTSRSRPQNYINETIEVGPLQPDEAFKLFTNFYKRAGDADASIINQIIAKAHYHTKLIILLAKASNNNPLLKLDVLADKVSENAYDEESIDIKVNVNEEERSVYEFILALFEPNSLEAYAKQYLRFFSILPSIEIPINHLFELFEREKNQGYLVNILNKLVNNGWIEKYSNDYYRIHPLIQLVTRRKLNPTIRECRDLIKNLNYILYESFDALILVKYLPYCESIVDYFRDIVDMDIAVMLNRISVIYRFMVQYEKSLDSNFLAIKIFDTIEPKFPAAQAQSYGELMKTYTLIGEYSEAIVYGKKCLEIQEAILNPKDADLAATYADISNAFRRNYQSDLAYNYVIKAIEIQKWLYQNYYSGNILFNLITGYNNLASLLADSGNSLNDKSLIKRALFNNYRALIISRRFLPEEHQKVALIYNDISLSLRDLHCLSQSLEYLKKAISINESLLSKQHPDLALNYYNMGVLYERTGDKETAYFYAQQALIIQELVYSPKHPIDV
jgi:tetratricopeptide (TPR) repeat protein